MADSTRNTHQRRFEAMKAERAYYEPQWQEANDFIVPGRYRPDGTLRKKPDYSKIVDETALLAYRIMRSGMQSGQTSPSRPWMRLTTLDPDLREHTTIKEYLYQVDTRLRHIMQASNLYNVFHAGYGDLGQFGQMAMLMVDDDEHVVRAIPAMTGQYWIAQNHVHRVDTLYRACPMTVEQMVGRFVAKGNGEMDWSKVSNTVKNLYDTGKYDDWIRVYHAVEPRRTRDAEKLDKRNKRFLSNYWEDGQTSDMMLEESGFDSNPILAPRWETAGSDVYASGYPGQIALPGIKMLQKEQLMKGEAIVKKVKPPMVAPTALRQQRSSILPGEITYVDSLNGQPVFRPAMEVNMDLSHLAADISEVQQRINRVWYADLFMAISQMEGVQPRNQFELTQRKEEQLLQLGPVIDRQQVEFLNPAVELVFEAAARAGLLPPPPKELDGQALKIDHISILAQAQKAVATGAIERGVSFVGTLAGGNPEILDKLDMDQAVDEYFDAVGAPPTIVRGDDEVQALRDSRAQQMQAAQQAEMAAKVMPAVQQGAQAAKLLSEAGTVSSNGSMVSATDLLSRLGIAG